MKIALTIFLIVVGVVMLIAGYTAPARAQKEIDALQKASSWIAEEDAKRGYTKDKIEENRNIMLDKLENFSKEETAAINGAIQYCAGWLMIAAAGIVFSCGRNEKFIPPTA